MRSGFLDQGGCLGKLALPTQAPGECYTGLHRRQEGLAEPFTRQIAFEQGKIVPEELDRRAIRREIMIGKGHGEICHRLQRHVLQFCGDRAGTLPDFDGTLMVDGGPQVAGHVRRKPSEPLAILEVLRQVFGLV